MKEKFNNYAELAQHKKEGVDYKITVKENSESRIVIVAPHGGSIEWTTSKIAAGVAANDHNLYIFEGLGKDSTFDELHITSAHFDEPQCVALIAKMDTVVAIHGCRGAAPVVYLGGLDTELKKSLADEFNKQGIRAETEGHHYLGISPDNICNKNAKKQGVQLEFSDGIRDNPALTDKCIMVLREHLSKKRGSAPH